MPTILRRYIKAPRASENSTRIVRSQPSSSLISIPERETFADSLSILDEVILCDIYPAREAPIPGVTSELIYKNLKPGVEKSMIHKEDVLDLVKKRDFDVLIVLGAGDLDNLVPQMAEILKQKECASTGRK